MDFYINVGVYPGVQSQEVPEDMLYISTEKLPVLGKREAEQLFRTFISQVVEDCGLKSFQSKDDLFSYSDDSGCYGVKIVFVLGYRYCGEFYVLRNFYAYSKRSGKIN